MFKMQIIFCKRGIRRSIPAPEDYPGWKSDTSVALSEAGNEKVTLSSDSSLPKKQTTTKKNDSEVPITLIVNAQTMDKTMQKLSRIKKTFFFYYYFECYQDNLKHMLNVYILALISQLISIANKKCLILHHKAFSTDYNYGPVLKNRRIQRCANQSSTARILKQVRYPPFS